MLIHGAIFDNLVITTVIPIPKGHNVNIMDSDNYRSIAMIFVFGKLFDLIVLMHYSDKLASCESHFGFKQHHSTAMYTVVVVKETISYYVNNGSQLTCTVVDASVMFQKTFDHILWAFCSSDSEILLLSIVAHFRFHINLVLPSYSSYHLISAYILAKSYLHILWFS